MQAILNELRAAPPAGEDNYDNMDCMGDDYESAASDDTARTQGDFEPDEALEQPAAAMNPDDQATAEFQEPPSNHITKIL